jgi:hypothetical protein
MNSRSRKLLALETKNTTSGQPASQQRHLRIGNPKKWPVEGGLRLPCRRRCFELSEAILQRRALASVVLGPHGGPPNPR